MNTYTTVVGLEVHVQLNTISKAFCADPNIFGCEPNTNISSVSLALPGTLPVLNEAHVYAATKLALALGATINLENRFDRKNYFYPDLPKGYQITQDNLPICVGGSLSFITGGQEKTVRIHHIHMEEDAGKNSHDLHDEYSMVDINRAGTPLVEIVTEPDLRSAQEVHDFISTLQQLVRYLDISDGNMEEGSLRCDVNVSVMKKGDNQYGERNEIKNVNSKKFAKTAVEYEAQRQISILEQGGTIEMNTLLFDPETGTTSPMRSKEEANDYRYFPDPDLPPVVLSQTYIEDVKKDIDWLPWTAYDHLIDTYQLSAYDAEILSREKETVYFYLDLMRNALDPQTSANFIINQILPTIQERNLKLSQLNLQSISKFITLLESGKVSKSAALSSISHDIIHTEAEPIDAFILAEQRQLIQSANQDFLDDIIAEIIQQFPDKVKAYRSGKKGLIGFFMGQVMSRSKGKANPQTLNQKLNDALNDH